MNRAQRRSYYKQIKNDKTASICPECNQLTKFYTRARGAQDTVLICEVCGAIVREGEELTKVIPPGIYCPVSLDVLDKLLLEEASRINNDVKENPNEEIQD